MRHFIVEIKAEYGKGPWRVVNTIKAENGRMAIDYANRIRVRCFGCQIPRRHYRVRAVSYEQWADASQLLLTDYDKLGQHAGRFEVMESTCNGCLALIDP